jgi:hypothetical protein
MIGKKSGGEMKPKAINLLSALYYDREIQVLGFSQEEVVYRLAIQDLPSVV